MGCYYPRRKIAVLLQQLKEDFDKWIKDSVSYGYIDVDDRRNCVLINQERECLEENMCVC
jgi:hypothetical protein